LGMEEGLAIHNPQQNFGGWEKDSLSEVGGGEIL